MNNDIQIIENALSGYIAKFKSEKYKNQLILAQAMEYSLMAGGKRIRPRLVLEFCRACGGNIAEALPFACAIEMIHTYSLIHDDLPCMDDDEMRRGRPSNHIKFGECTALLAGDALQSLAFEVMLGGTAQDNARNALRAAHYLAQKCGTSGMVGGQVIDIALENMPENSVSIDLIKEMYSKKTGALIKAACAMGVLISGGDEKKLSAAEKYAECVGLAFQIVDDILDITSTTEKLGKPVGSDEKNHKNTVVSFIGIEKAKETVFRLTKEATEVLSAFDGDTEKLKNIADSLAKREH